MAEKIRAQCGRCGANVLVRVDGTLRVHGREKSGEPCAMSGAPRLTAHDAPLAPSEETPAKPETARCGRCETDVELDPDSGWLVSHGDEGGGKDCRMSGAYPSYAAVCYTLAEAREVAEKMGRADLSDRVIQVLKNRTPEQKAETAARMDAVSSHVLGLPTEPETSKGAWFGAVYDGGLTCGHWVNEGDMIRADGNGGFECESFCGQDDPFTEIDCQCEPHRENEGTYAHGAGCPVADAQQRADTRGTWDRPTAANVSMPPVDASLTPTPSQVEEAYTEQGLTAPDAFLTPTETGIDAFLNNAPQTDIDAFLTPGSVPSSASSEDDGRRIRTRNYKHQTKDPRTGEFRLHKNGNIDGFTRVSTFVKAASDSTALNQWSKRNVLVGASRRPDLVLKAHGLDVREDSRKLNELVEQLETAADAKVSADLGTQVHLLTERIDRKEITLADVPPAFRPHIASYTEALLKAGLEVIPHLMERTVFIEQYESVGSFDRVLYHRASNTYVIGDVKTGKNLEYGWDEIEAQEWMYAEGYNRFGTYTWQEHEEDREGETWTPPEFQVRTDVGVVMWIPVDPSVPEAGTCHLRMTDLIRGHSHATLCGDVRAGRKRKGKPAPWASPQRDWAHEFRSVTSNSAAGVLWQAAKDADVDPSELNVLVRFAQDALRTQTSQMAE